MPAAHSRELLGMTYARALDWVDYRVRLDLILHWSTSSGNLRAGHSFAAAPEGTCCSSGVIVKMNRVGRVRFGEENDLPGVHSEVLDDMINRCENSVVALLHYVWARK